MEWIFSTGWHQHFNRLCKDNFWNEGTSNSFSGSSVGKDSTYNARDMGLISELERSLGEENNNPLQYTLLGNLMDRGVWRATVHGVAKSCTQLSYSTTTTTNEGTNNFKIFDRNQWVLSILHIYFSGLINQSKFGLFFCTTIIKFVD